MSSRRSPTPARSTSSSSARAPRAPTRATAARCASAPRTRSPPRCRSTPRTASSGSSATPSPARARRPRKKLTLVHKTNVLVHAGAVWSRLVAEVAAGVPRRRRRLPPRRRGDDLLDHRPLAVRRDRHRQPLRRHPHRPRRRHHRRHRAGGLAATSTPTAPRPRCSSPCTARRPTSPARAMADPTAAILSASLLLDHLGHADAAAAVEDGRPRRPRRPGRLGRRRTAAPPPTSATRSPPG